MSPGTMTCDGAGLLRAGPLSRGCLRPNCIQVVPTLLQLRSSTSNNDVMHEPLPTVRLKIRFLSISFPSAWDRTATDTEARG